MSDKLEFPYISVIPYNVMSDKDLQPNAKIYYGCLVELANIVGECLATNKQLAEMHGVSTRQVERWNKILKKKGYLTTSKGKKVVNHV